MDSQRDNKRVTDFGMPKKPADRVVPTDRSRVVAPQRQAPVVAPTTPAVTPITPPVTTPIQAAPIPTPPIPEPTPSPAPLDALDLEKIAPLHGELKPTKVEPVVKKEVITPPMQILPGFEDIPVGIPGEDSEASLRGTLATWSKQVVTRGLKDKSFMSWKNDLAWALRADTDGITEPVENQPTVKPEPRPVAAPVPPTPAPIVTVAPVAPRRLAVPNRPNTRPITPINLSPQTPAPTTPSSDHKTVDINISLPTLPTLPKIPSLATIKSKLPTIAQIRQIISKIPPKLRKGLAVAAVIIVGWNVIGGILPANHAATSATANDTAHATATVEKVRQNPTYPTLAPSGKSVDDLGGWSRVSPPDRNPVFAFADKIKDTTINVSQQPLPDTFKSDTASMVEGLAKSYNATDKVTIGDTVAYVGTSSKGPQSVIFAKSNLLILIKSTDKVSSNDWAQYINRLQ